MLTSHVNIATVSDAQRHDAGHKTEHDKQREQYLL